MRFMILAAAVAALAFASTAEAKSCKDAQGHYTKCPAPAAAPAKSATTAKGAPCKDAQGHFIKCPAAGAAPAAKSTMAKTKGGTTFTAPAPAFRSTAAPAKCKTGVPCGKSCIPKGKVCHKS